MEHNYGTHIQITVSSRIVNYFKDQIINQFMNRASVVAFSAIKCSSYYAIMVPVYLLLSPLLLVYSRLFNFCLEMVES